MKFGAVPLAEAHGAILAHSVPISGGRMRKGKVLDDADLAALQQAGIAQVTVARLSDNDTHEDDAARTIAEALIKGQGGVRLSNASTGRVNIIATAPGIARIGPERIAAVNRIDPMITVATVQPWQRLEEKGLIATIKIISYGVAAALVEQAAALASGAVGLQAVTVGSASLIETHNGGPDSAKGAEALAARLERMGVAYAGRVVTPHAVVPLAQALRDSSADVVFILTASATSDIGDTAPEALRAAGGELLHFGMPVDPGNLLFLGRLKGRPVIGLPGCARALALNGADWVLERVLCGKEVTGDDIAAMGVGGLLKDIPARGRPRRSDD